MLIKLINFLQMSCKGIYRQNILFYLKNVYKKKSFLQLYYIVLYLVLSNNSSWLIASKIKVFVYMKYKISLYFKYIYL